ncbi:MAG TPA: M20/M25/M40 family metallo-hydrolase [Solirubrobacterales bacterium]|jgi:succinyl-diaminopimelate desuccinylase|nr:M20/M25/M40 family metallo-hydrolase [Solirubrobacterales bacterium]
MDERDLAERLISYDTSHPAGITTATSFIKGWLDSNGFDIEEFEVAGLPVLITSTRGATGAGATSVPTIVFHGHIDVVPGKPGQFTPRFDGDNLIGRGAYDMKAALAAMLCAIRDLRDEPGVEVRLICVSDEESEATGVRGTDVALERGFGGDFAITGEPTNLHVGVQAKGVLALRLTITGTAAHGSTPWLGDNAVLKAHDVFRKIEGMAFARESSELFDRPSINLGRIEGGDAINKVPDTCVMDVDIRYVPGQDPDAIIAEIKEFPDVAVEIVFEREPAYVSRKNDFVVALSESLADCGVEGVSQVGRDGSSEATAFLAQGIPAVEFGPVGDGHHGPNEYVSLRSLADYRRSLVGFARKIAAQSASSHIRAV